MTIIPYKIIEAKDVVMNTYFSILNGNGKSLKRIAYDSRLIEDEINILATDTSGQIFNVLAKQRVTIVDYDNY